MTAWTATAWHETCAADLRIPAPGGLMLDLATCGHVTVVEPSGAVGASLHGRAAAALALRGGELEVWDTTSMPDPDVTLDLLDNALTGRQRRPSTTGPLVALVEADVLCDSDVRRARLARLAAGGPAAGLHLVVSAFDVRLARFGALASHATVWVGCGPARPGRLLLTGLGIPRDLGPTV